MDKSIAAIKIKKFLSLEDNWDSYGAPHFTQDFIDNVLKFIDLIPEQVKSQNIPEPWVVPGQGGAQLEFDNSQARKDLEIEIHDHSKIGYLKTYWDKPSDEAYIEGEFDYLLDEEDSKKILVQLFEWLMDKEN